jgi:uncharacterized protein
MNRQRLAIAALLLAAYSIGWAQTSGAKKELVQKVLAAAQPGIETMAQQLAEEPAGRLMQRASVVLGQRPAGEKRDATARDIQADLKKYVDEAVPIVRERAIKLSPTTIGAMLEEKFSEDELKQLVGILESPVNRRFQAMSGDMQRALGEKLIAETRAAIEPKVQALERSIANRLGVASPPASAAPRASGPARK